MKRGDKASLAVDATGVPGLALYRKGHSFLLDSAATIHVCNNYSRFKMFFIRIEGYNQHSIGNYWRLILLFDADVPMWHLFPFLRPA